MMKKILYILFGFFSTSPVLGLKMPWGSYMTFYNILLPVILIELMVSKQTKFKLDGIISKYILWAIIGLLSCGFGYIYFWGEPAWQKNALFYVPYVIVYLLMFILMLLKKDASHRCSYLIKGLFLGFLVNIIVAIIDSGIYYMYQTPITWTKMSKWLSYSCIINWG